MPLCCGGAPGIEPLALVAACVCIEELVDNADALPALQTSADSRPCSRPAKSPLPSCLVPRRGRETYRGTNLEFDEDIASEEVEVDIDASLRPLSAHADQSWKEDRVARALRWLELKRHTTNSAHKGASIARALQSSKELAEHLGFTVNHAWPTLGKFRFGPHDDHLHKESPLWMESYNSLNPITKVDMERLGVPEDTLPSLIAKASTAIGGCVGRPVIASGTKNQH